MTLLKRWFPSCVAIAALCSPAGADDWLTSSGDYAGSWGSSKVLGKGPKANSVMFELWEGENGLPTGVGIFQSEGKDWVGKLSPQAPTVDGEQMGLRFDPIESAPPEGAVAGRFKIQRWRPKRQLVSLVFVPDGVPDSPVLIRTNLKHYSKFEAMPPALEPIVGLARFGTDGLEEMLEAQRLVHGEILKSLHQTLASGFNYELSEPDLIGVWQGVIVDRRTQHPATIVLWPGQRFPIQKIFGAIVFANEPIRPAAIQVGSSSPAQATLTFNSMALPGQEGEGDAVHGSGCIQLGGDGSAMALWLDRLGSTSQRLSSDLFIEDLEVPEGYRPQQVAGVFLRTAPSAALQKTLSTVIYPEDSPGPGKTYWEMLSYGTEGLASLRALHEKGMQRNEEIFANRGRAAQERRAREDREYEEQQRAKLAEIFNRRFRGGPGGRAALPPLPRLPRVRGPFDDLRGGAYLNALHKGDLDAVAKFDRYYQLRKLRQQYALLGDHFAADIYSAAFRQTRLADTVLGAYLFGFQSRYPECLGEDAVVFKVVKTVPDVVTENLLGAEVMRIYGGTYSSEFKVKPAFASAFRRVGTTKPDGVMASVSAFLLNGSGTDLRREVLAGTRQLMARFDCNSKEVQRVEQSLLLLSR